MNTDIDKKGRFWPVVDDEYIVTVTQINGYDVLKKYKYTRWLMYGKYPIFIQKRKEALKIIEKLDNRNNVEDHI